MKPIKTFCALLWSFLRELGDENAYQRYLARHGCSPSREEWQRFCKERLGAKYQQGKCC